MQTIIVHPSRTTPRTMPSAREALAALLRSDGDINLAAERLDIQPGDVTGIITSDPSITEELAANIRNYTLLQVFQTVGKIHVSMADALPKLSAQHISLAYRDLLSLINQLTDNKTQTQNINIYETIMKLLPAEEREAFQVILGGRDEATQEATA